MADLVKLIESRLKNNIAYSDIKNDLVSKGYLERDVDTAARNISKKYPKIGEKNKLISKLDKKIIFDRIGYGFGSTQLINILFSMTGASLFFIGLINGIKSSLSALFSAFLNEFSRRKNMSEGFIRTSGLIFGFSFIFLALAVSVRNDILFAFALLLGSIGVVSYGDSFRNRLIKQIGKMNFSVLMSNFAFIGLIITAVSLIISGYLMDIFPIDGISFYLEILNYKMPFKLYGYLIAFMVTAFTSIFSAHILSKIKVDEEKDEFNFKEFVFFYFDQIKGKIGRFFKNKYLFVITLATLIVAIFQSVLNSFIGIHIYYTYVDVAFGGFANVAIIFAIAIVASFLGPFISAKLNKYLGLAPMFVFGAIIMTFLPLTVVFNPTSYFPAILVATALTVIGISIIGSGQSLLASRMLNEKDRSIYYASSGMVTVIPFLILVAILSSLAFNFGLVYLFKLISYGAIITLVPIYLVLVIWSTNKTV